MTVVFEMSFCGDVVVHGGVRQKSEYRENTREYIERRERKLQKEFGGRERKLI